MTPFLAISTAVIVPSTVRFPSSPKAALVEASAISVAVDAPPVKIALTIY